MYTKDKLYYEQLIRNSRYFLINEKEEPLNKQTEKNKLIENLFRYIVAIDEKKYAPYGLEIMEISIRCMKYFNKTQGEFLYYFKKSFKKSFEIIKAKEFVESRKGVYIPEEDKLALSKIKRYFELKNIDFLNDSLVEKASIALGINRNKIEELWALGNLKTSSNSEKNNFSEEYNLINEIASEEKDVFTKLTETEDAKNFLEKLNFIFLSKRESQQKVLAKILTSKIISLINEEKMFAILKDFDFFDLDIYNIYITSGIVLSAREIAQRLNVLEQSVSRVYANFLESLKKEI